MYLPKVLRLYSFQPRDKVFINSHSTFNLNTNYIALHLRHGKGTSAQNFFYYSRSSCRRQFYVIEARRTEKGTCRSVTILNVDPEHDRSLRSQKQIWWLSESENVMRMLPQTYSCQAFALLSVKTKSRLFWNVQPSSGSFGFLNLKRESIYIDLFSMTLAMTTTSAANDAGQLVGITHQH